ncbi:hypothetical protein G97194_003803 [Escherichia coli]|nr:hypothetical protein G97194_003803 [Escherichia coli]
MRALLTPEIAPRMGIVLFRPGSELMPLFMQGRVLLEPEPERYSSFASGAVPAASQPVSYTHLDVYKRQDYPRTACR